MRFAFAAMALLAAMFAGCVSQPAEIRDGATAAREVTAADFAAAPATAHSSAQGAIAAADAAPASPERAASSESEPLRLAAADEHFDPDPFLASQSQSALAPPPPPPPGRPPPAASAVFVDRMVGQVNGRPIFGNEFFEPIDDRLSALSDELSQRQFELQARQIVQLELRNVVQDQLFLAEAESELTTEQQAGLWHWLGQMEEQIILGKQGSRSRTEQELIESEGKTINEYLDEKRREVLIKEVYRKNVLPRIVVSWRDIQREYQRRYAEFHPRPTITVARISLRTAEQAELIEAVTQKFAAGESFQKVATFVGVDEGGRWQTFELDEQGAPIGANAEIRTRLANMTLGDISEPFELGSSTHWLHIQAVEQPETASLYDRTVQRQLTEAMLGWRRRVEEFRFINGLFESGIYDDEEVMVNRLVDMAVARHWRP